METVSHMNESDTEADITEENIMPDNQTSTDWAYSGAKITLEDLVARGVIINITKHAVRATGD